VGSVAESRITGATVRDRKSDRRAHGPRSGPYETASDPGDPISGAQPVAEPGRVAGDRAIDDADVVDPETRGAPGSGDEHLARRDLGQHVGDVAEVAEQAREDARRVDGRAAGLEE